MDTAQSRAWPELHVLEEEEMGVWLLQPAKLCHGGSPGHLSGLLHLLWLLMVSGFSLVFPFTVSFLYFSPLFYFYENQFKRY